MHFRRRDRGQDRENDGLFVSFLDVVAAVILLFGALLVFSRIIGFRGSPYVVLMHAALPLTLLPVWFALAITGWRGQPIRFVLSALLCVSYVMAVVPAVRSHEKPAFALGVVPDEQKIRVFSSNVFVDNTKDFSRSVLDAQADVLIFSEFAKPIEAVVRRSGVLNGYPYITDNGRDGVWRTVIYSRLAFADTPRLISVPGDPVPGTEMISVNIKLRNGIVVRVIGAHPVPLTVKGSDRAFAATVRLLQDEVRTARFEKTLMGGTPLIIAGDFNGTRWLPVTGQLYDSGLTDVHEAMGFGLSVSWPKTGLAPRFMRLDHAFYSGLLAPIALRDITIPGSDHAAFAVTFAVGVQPAQPAQPTQPAQ
jgi:endonuclease/exonuclease/phosphatase (EEP) superfamily protein YafD